MDTFVADLKKKSTVDIHDENLAKVVIDTGAGPGAVDLRRRACRRWAARACRPA